jgi:flagellar biosynthesis protein FlhB
VAGRALERVTLSDGGEKRFDATASRRHRAQREGNSARSTELSGVASFAAALVASAAALPSIAQSPARMLRSVAAGAPADTRGLVVALAWACVPACAAALAGCGATLVQTGGFRPAPIRFDLRKLAPQAGLKRMAGGEAAVGAARAFAALLAALAVTAPIGLHVMTVALRSGSPLDAAQAARDGAFAACFAACATGALFAGADYALVVRRWLHGLKMSIDEFKRDLKEQDGDPHARSRRRQMHRSLARGAIARTREASFVVVNPTHVAVALRYAPPAVPVPEILVRVVDEAALAVRAIAAREGVPVVENAGLARWLFRIGEPGRPIPAETFVAVAEVIGALIHAGALEA